MKKNGFTLIEITSALAILSIVTLVAISLLYGGSKTYRTSQEDIYIRQNVRSVMEKITADIKKVNNHNEISKVYNPDVVIDDIKYPALCVDNRYYYYDPETKSIFVKDSTSNRKLSDGIQSFAFTVDGNKVSVIITGIDGFMLNGIFYLEK